MRVLLPFVVLAGLSATSCGDDSPTDAGRDAPAEAAADAGVDAGARDAGPMCEACEFPMLCCAGTDGAAECVDSRTSNDDCGACGVTCTPAQGRGCASGSCVCGDNLIGCLGTPRNTCCDEPPASAGCHNIMTDRNHCGACGLACDPLQASECINGTCQCGDERRACAGADGDVCCVDRDGIAACRDFSSNRDHCGECNHPCSLLGSRCMAGSCTIGAETCATPCGSASVCCHGSCCLPARCGGTGCT